MWDPRAQGEGGGPVLSGAHFSSCVCDPCWRVVAACVRAPWGGVQPAAPTHLLGLHPAPAAGCSWLRRVAAEGPRHAHRPSGPRAMYKSKQPAAQRGPNSRCQGDARTCTHGVLGAKMASSVREVHACAQLVSPAARSPLDSLAVRGGGGVAPGVARRVAGRAGVIAQSQSPRLGKAGMHTRAPQLEP